MVYAVGVILSVGQNALQRLVFKLDEPCESNGPVGPHSLVLLASDIVTCETAVVRASIHSQSPSYSELPLSEDENELEPFREQLYILFPPNPDSGAETNLWQVAAFWGFIFDLTGSLFNVCAV